VVYPVADGVKGLTDLVNEQRFDLLCPWGREPKYGADTCVSSDPDVLRGSTLTPPFDTGAEGVGC